MKVWELLLELREYLNRHENYGAWIDSNTGKIHHVKNDFEHAEFIEQNFPESKKTDAYTYALENGLVRVAFNKDKDELNIEGTPESIRKSARIILSTIGQEDVHRVNIAHTDPKNWDRNERGFNLPNQRQEAQAYIRG